ncbi:hypothetical protein J6590_080117, partial [Homalodisca vitripennis]
MLYDRRNGDFSSHPGCSKTMSLFYENTLTQEILQRRARLLFGWMIAERSCQWEWSACPANGGGSEVIFKPVKKQEVSSSEACVQVDLPEREIISEELVLNRTSDVITFTTQFTQTDDIQIDTSNCKKCSILEEETTKLIETIRIMELDQKNNLKYHHYELRTPNKYLALSEEETQNSEYIQESDFEIVETKKRKRKNRREVRPKYLNEKKFPAIKSKAKFSKSTEHTIGTHNSLPHVTGSINVFGDSHAKELSAKLRPVLADNWNIFACASSGAPLSHVLQNCYDMTKQSGKNDITVIIGGSNDVVDVTYNNRRPARVLAGQILRATRQYKHTNVVIVGLFHRHDLPENCLINTEIKLTNKKLNELKDLRESGVSVLDVSKLSRQLFTRHGQHLNGAGKTALCKLIARAVENIEKRHPRGSTT